MAEDRRARYERQSRRLLIAYPPAFRDDHGAQFVGAMVAAAAASADRVSLRTAAEVVASGARTRARYAGVGGARSAFCGGASMVSTAALALQAAVGVASAVMFARFGAIFYLFDGFHETSMVGAGSTFTWIGLSALSSAAFLAAILGRRWMAAGSSLLVTTYLLVVVGIMVHTDYRTVIIGSGGGFGIYSPRYQNLVATPGLVGIAVLATLTSATTALRGRRSPPRPFAGWPWLALAVAVLAVLLSIAGDGNALVGSPPTLDPFALPNGGIMDAFEYLWIGAFVVAVSWVWLDARFGWAMVLLTIPVLAYSLSILLIARGIHAPFGTSLWWSLYGQMIGVVIAVVVLGGVASYAGGSAHMAER